MMVERVIQLFKRAEIPDAQQGSHFRRKIAQKIVEESQVLWEKSTKGYADRVHLLEGFRHVGDLLLTIGDVPEWRENLQNDPSGISALKHWLRVGWDPEQRKGFKEGFERYRQLYKTAIKAIKRKTS